MPKRKSKEGAVPDSKRKKNFSSYEVEILLQQVKRRRAVLLSSVSSGYKMTHKKDAWDAIARSLNAVSREGRTSDEVKKKWYDIKCEAKKKIGKYRREMLTTGEGKAFQALTELDLRIGAIIGETGLPGVPSAEYLDPDLGPVSAVSSPVSESKDELLLRQLPSEEEPGPSQPVPSCSSTPLHAPRSWSNAPLIISEAFLDTQERMAQSLAQIASTLATISETLIVINTNLNK